MPTESADQTPQLERTLGPLTLWGLGVGYVISGEYFGWNLGLPLGGSIGMLIAFVLVTILYVTFVLSYVELACAIPKAGGGFVYGVRGLGRGGGYFTGVAQVVEFIFAPPAIAMALGAYAATWREGTDPRVVALIAFLAFTALNLWGVQQTAVFELIVTLFAVGEILLFTTAVTPHVSLARFAENGLPNGLWGVVGALPFAIWFYLAIEGVANAAEEARRPQRDVAIGFGSALATLVVLAGAVLICAVGVGGWERIVWKPDDLIETSAGIVPRDGAPTSDSPLPLALGQIFSREHPLYHLLIGVGARADFQSERHHPHRQPGLVRDGPRRLSAASHRQGPPPHTHPRQRAAAESGDRSRVDSVPRHRPADYARRDGGRHAVRAVDGSPGPPANPRAAFAAPVPHAVLPGLSPHGSALAATCLAAMLWQNFSLTEPWLSVTLWYALAAVIAAAYYGLVVHWQPDVAANEEAVDGVKPIEPPDYRPSERRT